VDAVEKHLNRIAEQQEQLKLKEEQHKNLIQRYSLLKNAIEKAFIAKNKGGQGTLYSVVVLPPLT
jgi:hypothetical protein